MSNLNFIIREKCIFCNTNLNTVYFEKDYENYVAHYQVEVYHDINSMVKIPYNILICNNCKTVQTKYLGNLNEIYKLNHADSTGTTMINLHHKIANLIEKYRNNINNILEIGSSYGVLADIVISKNLNLNYNIIEPCYKGNITNKTIYDDFYENIDDTKIDTNTIIISHVFEHFYNPREILDKIYLNKNITNFFLIFPDLEYYINNNVLHVLNTEHTYYVDNQFLINELNNYGFELIERENYQNHSVIFYFKRISNDKKNIIYVNKNYSLDSFFNKIFNTINKFNHYIINNNNNNIYIWPSSIHSLYLCIFGLKYEKINGMLDNSINKIGKKMYGINLSIYSFNEIINNNDKNTIILINGGVFNNEIMKNTVNTNIKFIFV
jgi:hypothetical protein